jgi:hypothetical protein
VLIQCGQCGTRNEDGTDFCGGCGEFLEWTGARPATAAATAAVTAPVTSTPEVMQPGEERRPVARSAVEREPVPGEVPCGRCGAGNAPGRRFCRACGAELTQAAAPARLSWWRRLLARLRLRRRRGFEAGTRRRVPQPRSRRRGLLLTSAALAVVVVLIALLPARPLLSRLAADVRDRLASRAPATPVAQRASSSSPGTAPTRVADGATNRFWAPSGRPAGAWVEVDFAQPVRLLEVIVTPGVSLDKQQYLTQGRPHQLRVTVNGSATGTVLALRDQPGGQRFTVKADGAKRVRFTIVDTFGIPPGHLCAIGELEFFVRA